MLYISSMFNAKKIYMKDLRTVTIEYTEDYGGKGNRAWLITEFYNGEKTHQGHKVAKREYFSDLHIICQDYIKEGYTIEIKVAEGEVINAPSERTFVV